MAALSFKITADASDVTKQLNKAASSVQKFAGKVRKVSFVGIAKGADKLADKLQKLAIPDLKPGPAMQAVDKLKKRIDNVSSKQKQINLQINARKALIDIRELKTKLAELKGAKGDVDLKLKRNALKAQIGEIQTRLDGLRKKGATVPLNIPTAKAASQINQLKGKLEQISRIRKTAKLRIESNMPQVEKELQRIKKASSRVKAPNMAGLSALQKRLAMTRYMLGAGLIKAALGTARALQVVSNVMTRMSRSGSLIGKVLSGGFMAVFASVKGLMSAINGVGGAIARISITGLKGAAAALTAAVAGIGVAMKTASSEAMNLERLGVQFSSITGSVDEGADMVAHLREEAKRTGVEMGSMATMMRRLLASGMNTDEAKEMTASLLDISGALGLSNEEAKLLGVALAQVKSKGVASMEELRQQISEKGVAVFELLSHKVGKTGDALFKAISNGEVAADTVIEGFAKLEGPLAKFRGGADRMAATTGGAFARLKAQMKDTFAEAGKPLLDGLAIVVNNINKRIQSWGPAIKGFAEKAGGILKTLAAVFQAGDFGKLIRLSLSIGAKEFVNRMFGGLKTALAFFTIGMIEAVKTAWSKITDMSFWQGIGEMFKSLWTRLEAVGWRIVAAGSFGSAKEQAEDTAAATDSLADMQAKQAKKLMTNAGDGRTLADVGKVAAQAAADEFRDALKDPLMGTDTEKKELAALYKQAKEAAEAQAKAREEAMQKMGEKDDTKPAPPSKPVETEDVFIKPIASSLAKIGGGGRAIAGVTATLDKERNQLLKQVATEIKALGNAGRIEALPVDVPDNVPVSALPAVQPPSNGLINKIALPVMETLARTGVRLDTERNALLKSIDEKIGAGSGAVFV